MNAKASYFPSIKHENTQHVFKENNYKENNKSAKERQGDRVTKKIKEKTQNLQHKETVNNVFS